MGGGGRETDKQTARDIETDRQRQRQRDTEREERSKESHGERFGQPKTFIFFSLAFPELTVREGSEFD